MCQVSCIQNQLSTSHMVLFLKCISGCRLFVRAYASLEISSALLRQPRYDVVSEDFVLRREVGQDWRCTDLSTDERYLAHSIHGRHTMTNSLHFHQAFLFTRRCGGHEVVWISERAGHFTESRNGSLGRTCGAACTSSPPDCSSVRLRVKACWEGHIYSRSTRGTCPASKRVVRYGSCMYLIDN